MVGTSVGVAVGTAVGVAVGTAVGVAVGTAVGVAVGTAVVAFTMLTILHITHQRRALLKIMTIELIGIKSDRTYLGTVLGIFGKQSRLIHTNAKP